MNSTNNSVNSKVDSANTQDKKTSINLPAVRKMAIAKKRVNFVLLVGFFISCFSLSVFIGFIGPFLLFK